jgi:hypothetical protein
MLEKKAGQKLFMFLLLGGRTQFKFSQEAAKLLKKTKV